MDSITSQKISGDVDLNCPSEMDCYWANRGWDNLVIYPRMWDRVIQSVPRESRVLDLGCGVGKLLYRLKVQRGCQVKGIDHSPVAARIGGEHGIDIEVADIRALSHLGECWDIILATEVLEHLDDPGNLVRTARTYMNPGGTCFFSVPYQCLDSDTEPRHKRIYTPEELGLMLREYFERVTVYIVDGRMLATCGTQHDWKSYKNEITLSMIIRNEGATLRKALESAGGFVHEIQIFIDDRTDDDSESIAREFTNQVFYFTWENDFAKARNLAAAKATKDWILTLDGHEYLLPEGQRYLSYVDNIADHISCIRASVLMDKMKNGVPAYFFYVPRLYRNFWGAHYANEAHNVLRVPYGQQVWAEKFTIQHERSEENAVARQAQRMEMNVPYFAKLLEKNPNDTRALFHQGIYEFSHKNYPSAEVLFKRLLAVSNRSSERAQVAIYMALMFYDQDKTDECRNLLYHYMRDGWNRPELYMLLGQIATENGTESLEEARHWYNVAAHVRPAAIPYFLSWPSYTYLPFEKLAGIYEAAGDVESAVRCANKMLEYIDDPELAAKVAESKVYLEKRSEDNGTSIQNYGSDEAQRQTIRDWDYCTPL